MSLNTVSIHLAAECISILTEEEGIRQGRRREVRVVGQFEMASVLK